MKLDSVRHFKWFFKYLLFCLLIAAIPEPAYPAVVNILSPQNGAQYIEGETIKINADAYSDTGIHHASLRVDNQWVDRVDLPPFEFEVSGLTPGWHTINVSAQTGDNLWPRQTVSVEVLELQESGFARIDNPTRGDVFYAGEHIHIAAAAFSPVGIHHVSFYLNGQWQAADYTEPYTFSFTAPSTGTHEIKTSAQDNQGEWIYDRVSINVVEPVSAWSEFLTENVESSLYDWSFAGYRHSELNFPSPTTPFYNLTTDFYHLDHLAIPNDGLDDRQAIQEAINFVGKHGGGLLYFPPGIYDINTSSSGNWDVLKVNHDGVILCGAGAAENQSVLKLNTRINQDESESDHGEFMITVGGEGKPNWETTETLPKNVSGGETWIPLHSTEGYSAGQMVRFRMKNSTDEALSYELISPLEPSLTWTNLGVVFPFRFLAEVVYVGNTGIRIKEPLPQALRTKFDAQVQVFEPKVRGVGVENLMFTSDFDGKYEHNFNNWEALYGWCGVKFNGARDCWARNLNFKGFVRQVFVEGSYNVSIRNLISSKEGHFGVEIKNSCSCLVDGVRFLSPVTHGSSITGVSIGNVMRNFNNLSDGLVGIDFHGGGISSRNLCENMEGMTFFSGGSVRNMPHAGQKNTFWNIERGLDRWPNLLENEFFAGGLYAYPDNQDKGLHNDLHELFPESVVVGAYDHSQSITVDGQRTGSRNDQWLRVENLNAIAYPKSVYLEQLHLRLE